MAYEIRNTNDCILRALVAAYNANQIAKVASYFHFDATQATDRSDYLTPTVTSVVVAAANATDSATALTLINEIKAHLNLHYADIVAHDTAVSAAITTADGTDEATSITLANAVKADYNTHCSEANVHPNDDGTNTVAAADATDSATLVTLVNEIKADVNAHMLSKPTGNYITLVDA